MIEVRPVHDAWTWVMLDSEGRVLVYTSDHWDDYGAAFKAGLSYREEFFALASRIDHRMGACI